MKKKLLSIAVFYLMLMITIPIGLTGQNSFQGTNGPSGGNVERVFADGTGVLYLMIDDIQINDTVCALYRSIDTGASWQRIPAFQSLEYLIGANQGFLFAKGNDTLFRSVNQGLIWEPVFSNLGDTAVLLSAAGDTLYCYGSDLLISVDNGSSWFVQDTALTNFLVVNSSGHLIKSLGDQLLISINNGSSWYPYITINGLQSITCMAINAQDEIFVGTLSDQLYRVEAGGKGYVTVSTPFINYITCIEPIADGSLFCNTFEGDIYKSVDNGESWEWFNEGIIINTNGWLESDIYGNIYAGWQEGLMKLPFQEVTWIDANNGVNHSRIMTLASASDGSLYAMTNKRLMKSDDGGNSWQMIQNGWQTTDLDGLFITPNNTVLLVSNLNGWSNKDISPCFDGSCSDLLRSSDGGITWTEVLEADYMVNMISNPEGEIYMISDSGINKSIDDGLTWDLVSTWGYNFRNMRSDSEGKLYAQTTSNGYYYSDDDASTWQFLCPQEYEYISLNLDFEISSAGILYSLALYPNWGFWHSLFRSLNNGQTWESIIPNDSLHVWDIYVGLYDQLYLAADEGIFKSIDNGDSWIKISDNSTEDAFRQVIENSSGMMYASVSEGPVYKSDDFVAVQQINRGSEELLISPNPASESIEVEYPWTEPTILNIYNIYGVKIKTIKMQTNKQVIMVSDLPTGMYILTTENLVGKVIVKK